MLREVTGSEWLREVRGGQGRLREITAVTGGYGCYGRLPVVNPVNGYTGGYGRLLAVRGSQGMLRVVKGHDGRSWMVTRSYLQVISDGDGKFSEGYGGLWMVAGRNGCGCGRWLRKLTESCGWLWEVTYGCRADGGKATGQEGFGKLQDCGEVATFQGQISDSIHQPP